MEFRITNNAVRVTQLIENRVRPKPKLPSSESRDSSLAHMNALTAVWALFWDIYL